MSDRIIFTAKARTEDFGSAGSRRLLRAGFIPAVIYGKQAPVHCAVVAKDFMMKMHLITGSTLLTLNVDGTEHTVFVKTFQENLLKGIVNHIEVECLPKDLPSVIEVDVTALDINEGIRVGQIKVADGVKIHTPEDETVATVKAVKEEAPAAAEESTDASAAADGAAADTAAQK